jgi:hypothetical protein
VFCFSSSCVPYVASFSTFVYYFVFLQQGADAESSMKTKEMERQKWIQELGKEIK